MFVVKLFGPWTYFYRYFPSYLCSYWINIIVALKKADFFLYHVESESEFLVCFDTISNFSCWIGQYLEILHFSKGLYTVSIFKKGFFQLYFLMHIYLRIYTENFILFRWAFSKLYANLERRFPVLGSTRPNFKDVFLKMVFFKISDQLYSKTN